MFSTFETQLGHMALATLEGAVVGLSFGHPSSSAARKSLERFQAQSITRLLERAADDDSRQTVRLHERAVKKLTRFAMGDAVDFEDLPIHTSGMSDFQKRVVAACQGIPWGETLSYGQLATVVGHEGAARAVGTVMRKNRIPLIVPCHRVLASGGQIGGYSAPQGLAMKRRLLAMEKGNLVAR